MYSELFAEQSNPLFVWGVFITIVLELHCQTIRVRVRRVQRRVLEMSIDKPEDQLFQIALGGCELPIYEQRASSPIQLIQTKLVT